ncbi:MAG: electron transport complex subunit E [Clostridia bacterium]|nr:electron transport complex subunit E [Clostridia bacterium]
MNGKKILSQFKEGLLTNNPVFVQLLGMCSALAITTTVINALGMGISVTAVLICSNVIISLLRKIIPKQIRIASYIVIISGFVTVVEMLLKAFAPAISKSLGLFIPLIVVNCIILARAEAYASRHSVLPSAIDGLAMGVGYTVAVVVLAFVRELFGSGTVLGFTVLGDWYKPVGMLINPAGAFITLGCIIAAVQKFLMKKQDRDFKKEGSEGKVNG